MRKIIITISIILIIIITGFLIYLFLDSDSNIDFKIVDLLTDDSKDGELGVVAENKINILSQEDVLGYSINPATKNIYIINELGEIKKNTGSDSEKISSQKIEGINKVKSSEDGRKIMIKFNYPNQPFFSIYNTNDNNWTPLPKNTISADWHPENSNEIIYLNNNNLKILDLKKGSSRSILNIHLTGSELSWVTPSEVIAIDRPTTKYISNAWLINLSTKKINKVVSGNGLMINQKGSWRLTSAFNKKDGGIFNLINSEINKIVVNFDFKTLASKCVINQNIFYCAIPNQIPSNTSLPDDYLNREFISNDVIKSFTIDDDNQSIKTSSLYNGSDNIDAIDLKIIDNKLYFINRFNRKLYSLTLATDTKEMTEEEEEEEEEEGVDEEVVKEASQ
jgi:hypothetical protein